MVLEIVSAANVPVVTDSIPLYYLCIRC